MAIADAIRRAVEKVKAATPPQNNQPPQQQTQQADLFTQPAQKAPQSFIGQAADDADSLYTVNTGGSVEKPQEEKLDDKGNYNNQELNKSMFDVLAEPFHLDNAMRPSVTRADGSTRDLTEDEKTAYRQGLEGDAGYQLPLAEGETMASPERQHTKFSWLFGPGTVGEVAPGQVAWGDAQGEDPEPIELDYEGYAKRNPVDMMAADLLAAADLVASGRSEIAADNAEFSYRIGGEEYDADEVEASAQNPGLVIGKKFYTEAEADNAARNFKWGDSRYISPEDAQLYKGLGYVAVQQADDGNWVWVDNVTLPDGSVVNTTEFQKAVTRPQYQYQLPNGKLVTADDLKPVEAGGRAEYVQTGGLGPLNLGKVDPKSPLGENLFSDEWTGFDMEDLAPYMADVAAGSLPWMVPGWRELNVGAQLAARMDGYDPATFDRHTYTFADKNYDNGQWVGSMLSAPTELISERLGGVGQLGRGAFKTPLSKLGKSLPQPKSPALRGALGTARIGAEEGGEEFLPAIVEGIESDGLLDYYKDYEIDPETGEKKYSTTDFFGKLRNLAANYAPSAFAGGMLGGAMGVPQGVRAARSGPGPDTYIPPNTADYDFSNMTDEQYQEHLRSLLPESYKGGR